MSTEEFSLNGVLHVHMITHPLFGKPRDRGQGRVQRTPGGVQRDGATRRGHATATGRWATSVSWRNQPAVTPGLVEVVQGKSSQKMGSRFQVVDVYFIFEFSRILLSVYDYVFAFDGDLPCVEDTFGNVFWPLTNSCKSQHPPANPTTQIVYWKLDIGRWSFSTGIVHGLRGIQAWYTSHSMLFT